MKNLIIIITCIAAALYILGRHTDKAPAKAETVTMVSEAKKMLQELSDAVTTSAPESLTVPIREEKAGNLVPVPVPAGMPAKPEYQLAKNANSDISSRSCGAAVFDVTVNEEAVGQMTACSGTVWFSSPTKGNRAKIAQYYSYAGMVVDSTINDPTFLLKVAF